MNPYIAAHYDVLLPPLERRRSDEAMPPLKLALQSGAGAPYVHYALGNGHFNAGEYAKPPSH